VKNLGPALKVGITVVVAAALGYWAFTMLAKGKWAGQREALRLHAFFRDATGLVEKSQVQIAGLPMGHIESKGLSVTPPRPILIKQKRFARITMALHTDVKLYTNATVYKKATSLLGGYYLEIDPGTETWVDARGKIHRGETLSDGDEIRFVREAATTDDVIRQISEVMPILRGVTEDIRTFTKGPLHSISRNIDEGIRENRATIKSILDNMEGITGDVHTISGQARDDVGAILADIRATTETIRKLVGRSDKDVEQTAKQVKDGLEKLNSSVAKLDQIMSDVKGVTGDLQEGKGTAGRLLKDEKLINDVEGMVEDTGTLIKGVAQLQTIVGLHSEYNFQANAIKTYLQIELHPRPDKYYLIELIQDPRGSRKVISRTTRSDDPSKPQLVKEEIVEVSDAFRFTFQFAKRISFATFRFGIKENTGGVGLDLHFFDDRISLQTDLFDMNANVWPRLKVLAAWQFFKRLYVVGGIDDAFNDRPLDGVSGGRDFFVGGALRFSDEDLKTLLLFGGNAVTTAGTSQ
jgi:phospholipid/cholesterol/gamma-HCH transport system substrate-binding protein